MARQKRPLKAKRPTRFINKDVLRELRVRQKERRNAPRKVREQVVRKTVQKTPTPRRSPKPEAIIPKVNKPPDKPPKQPTKTAMPKMPGGKELLVGSIFINTSPLQEKWLDLQLRFLRATTEDFDHAVFLSDGGSNAFFDERTTVFTSNDNKRTINSKAHVRGLFNILDFFKKNPGYKNYLFLDSDSFPIRTDWVKTLLGKMKPNHDIAIPLRCENLETRLHSSIIFARPAALPKMVWHVGQIGDDICGKRESDVRLTPYQKERTKALPMLKSNQWSRHPLLCTVYHDLFYHHCCGSGRKYNMRSKPYWGHIVPQQTNVMETIDELMAKPAEFIAKVAGWNPTFYPKEV